jgi:hypothetical protein
MRASPACQVSLQRFGVWRGGVLGLSVLGAASVAAWVVGREWPLPTWVVAVAAMTGVLMLLLAGSLWWTRSARLHWDGQTWQLDAVPGELAVVIDLGPWMLLRFTPAEPARATWLPVQRLGLESQWHALRCAVYSPRPVSEP